MQIAFLNQDPGIGAVDQKGAAVHVESMRRAFVDLGARVAAVDHKDARRAAEVLREIHAASAVDLVYERYSLGADVGARFAREHGVPLVLEVNAPLLDEARAHRGRHVRQGDLDLERAVFGAATRVLAVSTAVADYVLRHGIRREHVLVRPNAVDSTRFAPLLERDRARAELGLANSFVLGFHGRLRPWHGFERIAAAASRLRADGIDARVLTIGAGDFERTLAAVLPRSAFKSLPWMPHAEVPRAVGCFDALALGYAPDAPCYFSPLKLYEAMAVGAVPVVPAAGDLPRAVSHGVDGLVYRAGDDDELVTALERLACNAAARARLAAGAIATARRHSWKSLAYEVMGFALDAGLRR
jgi:glycosyltransferase involved in cell wall biosynthesis